MCGIIGIVGQTPVAPRLIESLKRLEYRGYDSAGIAAFENGRVVRRRAEGKLRNLEAVLQSEPVQATVGVGHTRWATHGRPSERNAHPHQAGRVTVVHNGIIENFAELKAELAGQGRSFESETDTEVVAHLIDSELKAGKPPVEAFKAALDRLRGAYALAVIIEGETQLVLGARHGPPLVVGWGQGEMFLGSDALAVGPFTNRVSYLHDGDYVALDAQGARVFDGTGAEVSRPPKQVSSSAAVMEKGNYRHFMEKEIHDQPEAVQHTLAAYLDPVRMRAEAPDGFDFSTIDRIQIVACGTAYYAGVIAKYLFERYAGLPTDVEVASEFRYRSPALSPRTLAIAISQSGETADTLAALRHARAEGQKIAVVVNVPTSSMAREADRLWPTHAGPEIGVASTKAFTAQVSALTALVIAAAGKRKKVDGNEQARMVRLLLEAPRLIAEASEAEDEVRAIAYDLSKARDVLYLGRGAMSALAMEGALKLKEISYIHAEGYAAGELKHGPIALIDEQTPVIALAPYDELFEKTQSNLQEVGARGGPVIAVTDRRGAPHLSSTARLIIAPEADPLIAPLVFAPAIQLLAYYTAVHKGTDVDQPRNLAKSVTVE
ncbi:MAG: glutamine--fructose-6-phosphate transaminase (isomerizing) [Proteobacteria bacterium]|nr:glutamine--fructose-6-phosphate transaminase (isomerizing) [Pseudomonadota bacterium]